MKSKDKSKTPRAPDASALIELLVAVAIVVILAAMLLPAFSKGKERTPRTGMRRLAAFSLLPAQLGNEGGNVSRSDGCVEWRSTPHQLGGRNINTFASDGKFANSLPINPATPHRYFSLEVP
jgi:type II secretory pathway pseudopilin PulG